MSPVTNPHHERRWLILAVIGVAQLMVVLDATVVNVALPSAQHALHFSTDLRQWVITAYALAFGSLLLLGGRVGDLFGRKWTFIGGLLGFASASAVGGAAQSFGMLVAARATQGVFAAMLAPSALALLTTTFADGPERGKAFAVFTGIAGAGGAVGLLLGGALTQLLSWRFSLYVNVVLAAPAAFAAMRLIVNQPRADRPALDLPGVATGSLGLFCLVYGFSNAETHSWGAPLTVAMLIASGVLLAAFVALESRVRNPLLPLRVVWHRARGGSYLAVGIAFMAMFAAFLFLTYFLQTTRHYTPLQTGLAFLPMTVAIVVTAAAVNIKLLARLGPRAVIVAGMIFGTGGMVWLAQLTPSSSYAGHVLPSLVIAGVGMGCIVASSIFTATYRVDPHDAGVASAMVNTMQQVAGAIGTAFLSTIFASAMSSDLRGTIPTLQAISAASVHGDTVAFWVAAGIFAGGAILLALVLPSIRADAARHEEPRPEGAGTPRAEAFRA